MRKITGFLLVLMFLVFPAVGKDKKISFDEQAAWSYIKALADDSMQGRKSGHPGHEKAEKYIAGKFKEWGLEPAGDNGSYFQEFTVEYRYVNQGAALEIWTEKLRRSFYNREDWRVQSYSGSGNFVAEVVFAGYGIHAPDKNYDDFDGVDVKGKLVLFTTDVPKKLEKKLEEEAKIDNRVKAAKKLGALGVMAFKPPTSTSRYFRLRVSKELYDPDFVILTVESRITDFIFKELKTDLRYPFMQIEEKGKPQSFATGVKAFVSVNSEYDPKRATRNVLAKISGSDKTLKEEYVIIGGHMDHLGVSPLGDVYNGANDNASGTAVAMEIARVMKLNNYKPKRTIIFAGWAGEEMGLLGSEYFCDNPTMPIEKCVTYFNMDMVAHGGGTVRFSGLYYGPQIWATVKDYLSKEVLEYVEPGRGGPGGSDHSPFLAKGVPAYGIGSRGHHFKYHHVRDDSDLVKPEILKRIGDFAYTVTTVMADEQGDFIKSRRQAVYNLRYRDLINFKTSNLAPFVKHKYDVQDTRVDLQTTILKEKAGLSGDALRVDMINGLVAAADKIKKAGGLQMYSPSAGLSRAVRSGKTSVLTGLKGMNSFRDNPKWAGVLAREGVSFVFMDTPAELFSGNTLSEEGRNMIKAIDNAGILLMVKGAGTEQSSVLLKESQKPMVLLSKEVPGADILDLIKEKESAAGLILEKGIDSGAYFAKIEQVKEAVGTKHVMIFNEESLWEDAGKNQMLDVISQILKAEYDRTDFSNVLSSTFLRVLNAVVLK